MLNPDKILQGKDLEIDSEFDPDKVDSEEAAHPSPSTTTVEPVELKVV